MAKLQSKRKDKLAQIAEKYKRTNKNNKIPDKKQECPSFLKNKKLLYYSGFCLTDNTNFAFFYVDEEKIVDNNQTKDLNKFKFNEADIDMIIDKTTKLVPDEDGYLIRFGDIGCVSHDLFDVLKNKYPKCVFHQINSLFGQVVHSMIVVLMEEFGKPIGLLRAK